jgi:hypothetical protein
LSAAPRDAWKDTIDSYQQPSGFYQTTPTATWSSSGAEGPATPHWRAGEATATLALIGRMPAHNNSNYSGLVAEGPAAWSAFFGPLVRRDYAPCYEADLGGNDFHACGKIVGAAAYTSGAAEHADFFRWWGAFLANATDPAKGVVCHCSVSEHIIA